MTSDRISRSSTDRPPAAAPVFTGQPLERADRSRKDDEWLRAQRDDERSLTVIVGTDSVAIDAASGHVARLRLSPSTADGAASSPQILLGLEDGRALFATQIDDHYELPDSVSMVPLREVGATLPAVESGLASYAMGLVNWHRRHSFCANCGSPTASREGGYMRSCPRCGASHFPRLDPVVIMLVEHDGRLLLGRRHGWAPLRYSALAGFVSPGESVEEAVTREVYEESGITAFAPRFVASQPWPFPSSLMLGFHALSDGGDPHPRDRELEDVRWFTTPEIRAGLDEDTRGPLKLPPRVAVARFLIERWLSDLDR